MAWVVMTSGYSVTLLLRGLLLPTHEVVTVPCAHSQVVKPGRDTPQSWSPQDPPRAAWPGSQWAPRKVYLIQSRAEEFQIDL